MQRDHRRNPSWDDLGLFQKIEVMQNLFYYPALSLVCLFRRNVGYRVLNPVPLAVVAAIMFILGGLAAKSSSPDVIHLHAVLMLLAGFFQRRKRRREMEAGAKIHSWYFGDSRFESARTPDAMKRDRRMQRSVEPLLAFVAGACVLEFSPAWGLWLIISAIGLGATEAVLFKKRKDREMDTLDAMIESEDQAQLVEEIARRHSTARIYSNDKADVIHAKLSDDVEALIARRKKRPDK
jgi:hypothetical protein